MIPEPPNYSLSLNSWPFHTVFILLLEWYFYLAYPIMLLSYVGKKTVCWLYVISPGLWTKGRDWPPFTFVFSRNRFSVFV